MSSYANTYPELLGQTTQQTRTLPEEGADPKFNQLMHALGVPTGGGGEQASSSTGADEQKFASLMNELGKQKAPPSPSPALTYAGFEQAKNALEKGNLSLGDLLEGTRTELDNTYGPDNVRPVMARGGRFVDYEVKQGTQPWRSSGAKDYLNQLVQAQQSKFLQGVDQENGAGFGARLEANVKMTPEGKYGNLVARYGEGNVVPLYDEDGRPSENFAFRESPTAPFRKFDPGPSVVGDWPKDATADIGGDTLENAPGMVAGLAASRFGAPAAHTATVLGDVAGTALRQAVSAALPGDDNLTPIERIQGAAVNAGAGVAGEFIGRLAGSAWKHVGPKGVALDYQKRAFRNQLMPTTPEQAVAASGQTIPQRVKQSLGLAEKPEALAGVETAKQAAERNAPLFKGTDITPTPGQLSGSQDQIGFESTLRQAHGSRDIWTQYDIGRELGMARQLDKTIKALGENVGADEAGTRLAAAGDAFVESLAKRRTQIAGGLFRKVDAEAAAVGNQRIVPMSNTLKTIDRFLETTQRRLGLEDNKKIFDRLTEARKSFVNPTDEDPAGISMTMRELQNELEDFGKASRGKGSFIKDIDSAADKRYARAIFDALNKDLDEAANRVIGYKEGPVPIRERGDLPQLLKDARDSWAAWSESVDSARTALLDKVAGFEVAGTPHKAIGYILGKDTTDEQVKMTVQRLAKLPEGAEAIRNVQTSVMEKIASDAAPGGEGQLSKYVTQARERGEELPEFIVSMDKFASSIAKNRTRLAALFVNDPAGLAAINKLSSMASILGDRAGMRGSQTGPFGLTKEALSSWSKGEWRKGFESFNTAWNARRLSIMFNDPEQRAIFMGLASPKRDLNPRQASRMMAKLVELNDRANQLYTEGEPQAPDDQTQGTTQGQNK